MLIVASLSLAAYAATSISISNTSSIQAGQSIAISQPTLTSFTSCTGASYTTSPTALSWTLSAGGSPQTYYFCEENTGTASDTAGATVSGAGVAAGTCPAAVSSTTLNFNEGGAGTLIAPQGATSAPLTLNVCAGGAATPGTGPTFTIVVT